MIEKIKDMQKLLILFLLLGSANSGSCQSYCDTSAVNLLLNDSEKAIFECLIKIPFEKYLGLESVGFYDSLIDCAPKKISALIEGKGVYYTKPRFKFTEWLILRFHLKELKFGRKNLCNDCNKYDSKIFLKEVPYSIEILYGVIPLYKMKKE